MPHALLCHRTQKEVVFPTLTLDPTKQNLKSIGDFIIICYSNQQEWNQVSNNVKPGGNFVVLDLDPANWYQLRVTAHNNAGFSVAEYKFATLTVTGGTTFSFCHSNHNSFSFIIFLI